MAITGPTTDIEIISDAATLVGKAPFSTIDDGGDFALAGKQLFNLLIPKVMSEPYWRFNLKVQQLQLIANFDPDYDTWQYAWQLPADFLSLESIYPRQAFNIFGDQIWTRGNSPTRLLYRSQLPISKTPVYLRDYLVQQLAIKMAYSVAESAQLAQNLKQDLPTIRAEAMFIDAQNHPNVGIESNYWVTARGGWRNGNYGGGY